MTISFLATSLNAISPMQRERLQRLTLTPRHAGDRSVFATMLMEPMKHAFVHATIALVAVEELDGEPAATRWIGWALAWWLSSNQVARVGVFVAEERRGEGVATTLVRRVQLATQALGLGLRANATSDAGARVFEKLGIDNDGRSRAVRVAP